MSRFRHREFRGGASLDDGKGIDSDIRYMNVNFFNSTEFPVEARTLETRNSPIVERPVEYEASVVRFRVNTNSIPIFVPRRDPSVPGFFPTFQGFALTNSDVGPYSPINATTQQAEIGVFSYTEWLDQINIQMGISLAFVPAPPPGLAAPFFALNPATGLISMFVQTLWMQPSTLGIYFNYYLQNILRFPYIDFNGFGTVGGRDYQIRVTNSSVLIPPVGSRQGYPQGVQTIVGDVLQVSQEQPSLFLWNELKTITFISTLMPTNHEYQPNSRSDSGVDNSSLSILTDFDIIPDEENAAANNVVQYFPPGEYRMFTLNGTNPITQVDIRATWTDVQGISRQLLLNPLGSMSLKLMFRKKRGAV